MKRCNVALIPLLALLIFLMAQAIQTPQAQAASGGDGGITDFTFGWVITPSPTFTPPATSALANSFDFVNFLFQIFQNFGVRGAYYLPGNNFRIGLFIDWTWSTSIDVFRSTEKVFSNWSNLSIGPTIRYYLIGPLYAHVDLGATRHAGTVVAGGQVRMGWHGEAAVGVVLGENKRGLSITAAYQMNGGGGISSQAFLLRVGVSTATK